MKKLSYAERVRRDILSPVLQEIVDATENDLDKDDWATLHKLLADNATVTRYELQWNLHLLSAELYWCDEIKISTRGGGQLEYSDDEVTVTLEFPRNISRAICNGIETFADDVLSKTVRKYGFWQG